MKDFYCAGCGMRVFFENDRCVKCGRTLGFLPDSLSIEALEERAGNQWFRMAANGDSESYRKCENENQHHACNWMVPHQDENPFCLACRLNVLIPDLLINGNCERWRKLEQAKKRCLYTLRRLAVPVQEDLQQNRPALRFRFLADTPANGGILTGHEAGLITVNIAEADDDERERRRVQLSEPHRTLIGHLRHELGHYYWDRLIANGPHLLPFRELFGDERLDYQASLQRFYREGAAGDWPQRTLTAYASAHPWEDWAETWAHYLHIYDTVETTDSFGLKIGSEATPAGPKTQDFDQLFQRWLSLSCALNCVNRGMGLPDLYPFIIPAAAARKLRFVHNLISPR